MAWCWAGTKPLSEPIITWFLNNRKSLGLLELWCEIIAVEYCNRYSLNFVSCHSPTLLLFSEVLCKNSPRGIGHRIGGCLTHLTRASITVQSKIIWLGAAVSHRRQSSDDAGAWRASRVTPAISLSLPRVLHAFVVSIRLVVLWYFARYLWWFRVKIGGEKRACHLYHAVFLIMHLHHEK